MLVLFETASGYALFKLKDGKVKDSNYSDLFDTSEKANKAIKLQNFVKFDDTTEALAAATAVVEGKMDKVLKKFLKANIVDKKITDELAVADSKIGVSIKEKLGIQCMWDSSINELMRGIRGHMDTLISGLRSEEMGAMQLGLAHSLSRYHLKFSPDKVDTMIVQAISLLDDLDKELNIYSMRVREWYGWHFPEMSKIVGDNLAFARTVLAVGMRANAADTDLSAILPEDVESDLKEAAVMSMGTEISEEDLDNIKYFADQVIHISEYRTNLYEYLKNRMNAIAPNVTVMVGELVGARLIAHAGSLLNLAKQPASTVQILGAEKALFRALKTKHDTPKYGLLYNASIVGQSSQQHRGKMSRVLAAKTSLVARIDALADEPHQDVGIEYRAKVEQRLRQLEGGASHKMSRTTTPKGEKKFSAATPKAYNNAADSTMSAGKAAKRKADDEDDSSSEEQTKKVKEHKEKKEKKEKKKDKKKEKKNKKSKE